MAPAPSVGVGSASPSPSGTTPTPRSFGASMVGLPDRLVHLTEHGPAVAQDGRVPLEQQVETGASTWTLVLVVCPIRGDGRVEAIGSRVEAAAPQRQARRVYADAVQPVGLRADCAVGQRPWVAGPGEKSGWAPPRALDATRGVGPAANQ